MQFICILYKFFSFVGGWGSISVIITLGCSVMFSVIFIICIFFGIFYEGFI